MESGKGVTLDGNITIEASIIVPFMLIVLATILMVSLLLHDVYVLRTNNAMRADAYAIAGEDTRGDQDAVTFIIDPVYEEGMETSSLSRVITSSVTGAGNITLMKGKIEMDDTRSFKLRSPKAFVRTIDFVDDATDLWSSTRSIKNGYMEKLEDIEHILKGEE